jgi:hypothetical protein
LAGVRVYRSTASGVLGEVVANTKAGTFTDTGLVTGTKYYYILRPVDTSGNELVTGKEYEVVPAVSTGTPVTTTPASTTPPPTTPVTTPTVFTYPTGVSAYDLVKNSTMSAVYFVSNGKRYPFPSEMVYKSWYPDFSGVKKISDADLASLTIGGVVKVRPGTFLIKITSDPKVYAVEPSGLLRWVESESVANALYGSAWATKVRDLDVSAFQGYTIGSSIAMATYPVGSVVTDGAKTFYVDSTGSRELKGDALTLNRIDSGFVLHTSATMPAAGSDVTGSVAEIAQPVKE